MARAARQAGFDVHVACRVAKHGAAIEAEGFALHALDWGREQRNPLRLLREIAGIRRLLRQVRPALVHQVAIKPALFGSLASTGLRLPTVNSVAGLGYGFLAGGLRGRLLRAAMTGLFRWILNRRRVLTVVQNPDDRAAVQALGVADQRLRLVPGSGLPLADFPVLPEPEGSVTFGFVSRMLKDKGILTLVDAFDRLRQEGRPVRLLLAGDIDPANPASLDAAAMREISARDGVIALGHVSDVSGVWARSHVAVLPSRREGMPRALLEGAASGRPLLATDVPGCRELVRPGQNGLLVPYGDAPALAAAMATLADDPKLRASLGAQARRDVEDRYSAEAIGAATVAIYREVLDPASALA